MLANRELAQVCPSTRELSSRLCSCIAAFVFIIAVSVGNALAADNIPAFDIERNATGAAASYQPNGPTSRKNPFFQSLGSNGRACETCHQASDGWSITPAHIQARFEATNGTDPLFRLVDGATCDKDDVSTPAAMRKAYALVLNKGLIRVSQPFPRNPEFSVMTVADPYGCTAMSSGTSGAISVYRRPLPATNLNFLSAIMWDGREPSFTSQAINATLIHAQASAQPSADQLTQIVNFETGIFTAQFKDNDAGTLQAAGANGGPNALATQQFFIGINDPLGLNPIGAAFDPAIFNIYDAWSNLPDAGLNRARIGREG